MTKILMTVLKMLIPFLSPFLKRLIDLAYEQVEAWADRMVAAHRKKPTSEEKMQKAIKIVRMHRPDVPPEVARAVLEFHHAVQATKKRKRRKEGKTKK